MLLKYASYSLFFLVAVFVSACGQKGPLYIQESIQDSVAETGQNSAKDKNTKASKPDASNTQAETDLDSETAPDTESKK